MNITPNLEKLIADAKVAGYVIRETPSDLSIVNLTPTGRVRRGLLLYPDGTGYDISVRCDVAKGLRSYAQFRTILKLNPPAP